MKLYRIIVLHGAPKDTHIATETYLIAEDDTQVAEWINKEKQYGGWFDNEDLGYYLPGEGGEEKEVSLREWVMANKGDLEDEAGWEDAYYGVTKYGWEEIEGAGTHDMDRLVELGIAAKV